MKPKAIILDIDGVILNTEFILREIHEKGLKGDEMWDYFYNNCNSDRVQLMQGIKEYIQYFTYDNDVYTIISTARNEKCASATKQKLQQEGIYFDKLYMRLIDDLSPAACVKREHLERIMKDFDVIAFIDDDLTNCQMAKSLGILALRVV